MDDMIWNTMEIFPKDGTRCTIEFVSGQRSGGWFWGQSLMGKGYGIRGDQNMMSAYLRPVKWTVDTRKVLVNDNT